MNIEFSKPIYLILIFPFLYLFYWYIIKQNSLEGVFFPVKKNTKSSILGLIFYNIHYIFLLFSAFFLVFSLASPRKEISAIPIQKNGRAFIFCLDVSSSMKAPDIDNKERIEIAKTNIIKFIKKDLLMHTELFFLQNMLLHISL